MKLVLPVFSAVLLLTACSETTPKEEKIAEISVADYDQNITLDNDFILPQPITLVEAFSAAGLTYQKGLTNPVVNKDKYSLKADQLLNIGAYSADLAYSIMNNRSQDAADYLNAIQVLGAKAGLERVFSDKEMIAKFEKNLDNQAELKDLIYEIQENMDDYLQDNDLRHLAAVQFAGAWSEALYIACSQWKDKIGRDAKINTAIAEQMNLLDNLVKGLKVSPAKDERLNAITSDLENLQISYDKLESVQAANANTNISVPQITVAEFGAIFKQISAIRGRIITGK